MDFIKCFSGRGEKEESPVDKVKRAGAVQQFIPRTNINNVSNCDTARIHFDIIKLQKKGGKYFKLFFSSLKEPFPRLLGVEYFHKGPSSSLLFTH